MKILYIITKSNFGGAQRYVFELARSMKGSGHEVAVACGGTGLLTEKLAAEDIPVFTIESFQRDINLKKELASLHELWHIIREYRPDVVHLNSSKAGGSGAFISRMLGVPKIIFTAHGWPFRERRSLLAQVLLFFASALTTLLAHEVIVVSAADKKGMALPFLGHKCTIIRTAVPTIPFRERTVARAELFDENTITAHAHDVWLVTNAELTTNKNQETAINAIANYNRTHGQKIFYSLIGDGELRQTLLAQIRELGAESHIVLLGYVEEAREYLHAFDLFLLSSLKEGMPYALLEAGAAILPSIASNVGGIPEVITHEVTGMLVDGEDTRSIEEALALLIENPEIRVAQSEKLHEKIVREFDLNTMINETKKIYDSPL